MLVLDILAHSTKNADGLRRQLVVQNVVGGKNDGLTDRFRVNGDAVLVFQASSEMGQELERHFDVRLGGLHPREELGEIGIVGNELFELAGDQQSDKPAARSRQRGQQNRLVG